MGYIDKRELSNADDVEAWDSTNEHLFRVLRLRTTGAACSLLLQFEPKYGKTWRWKISLASFTEQIPKQFLAA